MLLWTLLKKDLLRASRRPGNYIVMMMLPVALTAIMGLTFGSGGKDDIGIPQIQVAFVDNDQNFLSGFMKVGLESADELQKLIQLHDVTEEEGQEGLENDTYSAMVILPEGLTASYFASDQAPKQIKFVRNAQQKILPGIVEDIFAVFTDGLNTVKMNAADQLLMLRESIQETGEINEDSGRIIAEALGMKLIPEDPFLVPIIQSNFRQAETQQPEKKTSSGASIFANLFTGVSAFFLLFLANTAAGDFYTEYAQRTLQRFRMFRFSLTSMMFSKAISAVAIVFIASLILFGVGGFIFDVPWRNPLHMVLLCFSYSVFAAGLMTFLTNWAGNSGVSDTLNPIIVILIGFFGGGMIPVRTLPEVIRDNISPLFPNLWFSSSMIKVQLGGDSGWLLTSMMLLGVGAFMALAAAVMMDRRLSKGVR